MSTVELVTSPTKESPPGLYLEPNTPQAIEMRNNINFTRLPQNPPMDAMHGHVGGGMKPEVPMIHIANGMNGTPTKLSADYTDDTYGPSLGQQHVGNHQAVTTFGQVVPPPQGVSAPRPPRPRSHYKHTYEELPTQTQVPADKLGLVEENGQTPYGHHMAHTEVDQAMLFPQPSSQVALTSNGSSEKRPRKKMNPIYDGYQGPSKVISTKGSSKPAQHHGSPVKQCSSCSVKCLKSPCTTFLVILVVFVMVIAGVLVFMGKITTPATGGKADELSQPKSSTSTPYTLPTETYLPEDLLQRLDEQDKVIVMMQEKISMLESLLGGSDNINASISTKVVQNSIAIDSLQNNIDSKESRIGALENNVVIAEGQITNILGDIIRLKDKTANLESNTTSLDRRLTQLNAKADTQNTDIQDIKNKNTDQDNNISDVDSRINIVEQESSFQLSAVNRTIYGELDVISKMEGPRGYNGSQGPQGQPGAGNLTLCTYGSQRSGGGFGSPTETPWISPGENFVFTGMTCSTQGGEGTVLEQSSQNPDSFRCVCHGNNADRADQYGRDCAIKFWKCPATS